MINWQKGQFRFHLNYYHKDKDGWAPITSSGIIARVQIPDWTFELGSKEDMFKILINCWNFQLWMNW